MATEDAEDTELATARDVIEQSKDALESKVKFWDIAFAAREVDLIDDEFIDSLMKKGLSAKSNAALLSMFMETIRKKDGWFGLFLNILSDSGAYKYRPLAEELSGSYHEKLARKRGLHPSFKLLDILRKAVELLKKCKKELQKALQFHGLVSVQHSVNMLTVAVDYLQIEVENTEGQSKKRKDVSRQVERLGEVPSSIGHGSPTHSPRVTEMNLKGLTSPKSDVASSERLKPKVKAANVTARGQERSQSWGYSEMQVVHEVLKRNRGYLELKIPIEVIITELHGQDLLLDYEYAEVTSQPFPIKKNRSLIDVLLRKAPSTFYQFCSILEGHHGYAYIAHHLIREVQHLDPTIPLEDKMKTFGIAWSPGPKGAGPSSKRVPPTVDALVDKEMLNESIQSIVDKQREMANEVKKVHQNEVSQLKKAVSDAEKTVEVVKTECTELVQQMQQGKVDSVDHVHALQGKMKEIIQACEKVQAEQLANSDSSIEAVINAVNLEHRIGQLTTQLEKQEKELQIWKGAAERREKSLSVSQERCKSLETEQEELKRQHQELSQHHEELRDQHEELRDSKVKEIAELQHRLSKSEKKNGDLEVEHKELRNRKDREIEGLRKKWEASQDRITAVTSEVSAYQERCKSLATENEELRRQHKKLVRQHEELRDSKNEEIKALEYRLSKSEKEYGDLDVKHKELRIGKDREIEGLQKKWEASQDRIAAITRDLSVSQERYKSLETEQEELKQQHEELSQQHEELSQQHEELSQQHEEQSQQHEELSQQHRELTQQWEELLRQWEEQSHRHEELKQEHKKLRDTKDTEIAELHSQLMEEREREMMRRMREREMMRRERREERRERREERRRGYDGPHELSVGDVERLLQMMATNGEHVVWKDGEKNLKLSVWKDGKCYHLPLYKRKEKEEPPPGWPLGLWEKVITYSLDEDRYFDSIEGLCAHYKKEPLPGHDFKLSQ